MPEPTEYVTYFLGLSTSDEGGRAGTALPFLRSPSLSRLLRLLTNLLQAFTPVDSLS